MNRMHFTLAWTSVSTRPDVADVQLLAGRGMTCITLIAPNGS